MSVPYVSLLSVVHNILGVDQCAIDFITPKVCSYKLHVAHLVVLDACITTYSLSIIDELKAMFINGNTNVSTVALIPLIKAKYEANKDVSNGIMLERSIIIDLHQELCLSKSIGRNQLLIELTLAVLKHTNKDVYDRIMHWK